MKKDSEKKVRIYVTGENSMFYTVHTSCKSDYVLWVNFAATFLLLEPTEPKSKDRVHLNFIYHFPDSSHFSIYEPFTFLMCSGKKLSKS